jgi:hypothetical protein
MALANFFDKIALGASQLFHNYDRHKFEATLLENRIAILFDENAANTDEGRYTLDLLVRLIARLYPSILIKGPEGSSFAEELKKLAFAINPVIEFFEENPTVAVAVGNKTYSGSFHVYYTGSDNWLIKFSTSQAVSSGATSNPFGAGGAACIGASNIFRFVFRNFLPHSKIDSEFTLSMLDFGSSANQLLIPDTIQIPATVLMGLGAIGNSAIWCLSKLVLMGQLYLNDHENISLTNLQRYVMADQHSIDKPKTELALSSFKNFQPIVQPVTWQEFIASGDHWKIHTVLTAVDNAADRITGQGLLSKEMYNAWTQQENLGVSRHTNFVTDPCICCLYYPNVPKKSRAQEVADNLNITHEERFVRNYLANHKPVDELLLDKVAAANNIPKDDLLSYTGASMDVFYSSVVCGGMIMNAAGEGKADEAITVPSAFESAFAGILLSAEFIKGSLGYDSGLGITTTQFNLIRGIAPYLNIPSEKHPRCICNDPIYQEAYRSKWG